uniref:Uncharacterized protein n=2 Tax=Amorphochlora amoebiformis TaxID=1561963 RepID=A0A7S0H6J8_9EUKA|mmetsp:Transcript_6807/g.10558  ORF Transcript_6807/g.10558 Transcript_6807/m.10558 type:complete len:277 (+) Transcript_6807:150-980(+)
MTQRSVRSLAEREVSNRARLRQEAANPFGVVRLWGSGALSVQALVASLVAITRLTASIGNAPGAAPVTESLQTLGIDLACFGALAAIFLRERAQEAKRLQKFEREEMLSQLVVELPSGRRMQLQDIQGFARLVIVSDDSAKLKDSLDGAEELRPELSERAVIVVPVDTGTSSGEDAESIDWAVWRSAAPTPSTGDKEPSKPFVVKPVRIDEWRQWLLDQKEEANLSPDQGVWISLRKDGRVRSSGKGSPPWMRFARTLPPDKGAWGGFLDGMDGRV